MQILILPLTAVFFGLAAPVAAQLVEGPQQPQFAESYAAAEKARAALIAGDVDTAFELGRALAEAGNPVAQNIIGLAYDSEDDPRFDPVEALVWFQRAADQDYPKAWHNIGDIFVNGREDIAVDRDAALTAYVEAADLNYEPAFEEALDLLYEDDLFDLDLTVELVTRGRAMFPENVYLQLVEADTYYFGWGRPVDYETSLRLFEEIAAESGDAYAQWSAGYQFHYGEGTDYDPEASLAYFELAAEQDHAGAIGELSQTFLWGYGVDTDYERARRYAERGQALGNVQSALSLGEIYYYGYGVEVDYRKARQYFDEARAGGDGEAITYLADMAYWGHDEPQDQAKALALFQDALSLMPEDHYTNFSIGFMLMRGEGAPADVGEALIRLLRAREYGSTYAAAELALIYGDPTYQGVQSDPLRGMAYCLILEQDIPGYRSQTEDFATTIEVCAQLRATLQSGELARALQLAGQL